MNIFSVLQLEMIEIWRNMASKNLDSVKPRIHLINNLYAFLSLLTLL
jgi:hypothetical protein